MMALREGFRVGGSIVPASRSLYEKAMMKKLTLARRKLTLNDIPCSRRHIYFYALLILTAVVLSNMKDGLLGDPAATAAKAKHAASRIVGAQAVQSLK
jgi:hypothetical protein